MTYKIKEMSWTEFQRKRKDTDTIIVPTGAVEVYGPHLPMGADGIAAEAVAERVAERTGALVAPLIEIGESTALIGFPGTLSFTKETFHKIIDEIFSEFIRYEFKNFLFITGHASNVDSISYLSRKYQREKAIRCGQIDWWRFTNANGDGVFDLKGFMAHGHASECGTSVMLYLRPDLVHMEGAVRVDPTPDYTQFSDVLRYVPFEEKTDCGIVGDATIGTAEKGEKIVTKCVDRIVSYMEYEFKKTY